MNIATLDMTVAQAAHSIHHQNQNINIGSSTRLTQPAIKVGIIPNLASHTQRNTHVAAIHTNINGIQIRIILK